MGKTFRRDSWDDEDFADKRDRVKERERKRNQKHQSREASNEDRDTEE